MKKFDIKKLLILLLALVLVFALAACDGGDDPGGPTGPTGPTDPDDEDVEVVDTDAMFDILSSIGGNTVDVSKSFVFELGLCVKVTLGANVLPVDIGLTLLLDPPATDAASSEETLNGSAAMINLDINGLDVTLYYLLADSTNIYIQSKAIGGNQVYTLPFLLGGDDNAAQSNEFTKAVFDFLQKPLSDSFNLVVWDVIANAADDFGTAEFNVASIISDLANKILGMFKDSFDLVEIVSSLNMGLEDALGIDAEGNIHIEDTFRSLADLLQWIPKNSTNGVKNYKGEATSWSKTEFNILPSGGVGGIAWGMINGMISSKSLLNGALYDLLNYYDPDTGRDKDKPFFAGEINVGYSYDSDKKAKEFSLTISPKSLDNQKPFEIALIIHKFRLKNADAIADAPATTGAKVLALDVLAQLEVDDGLFNLTFDPNAKDGVPNQIWAMDASWVNFWNLKGMGTLGDAIAEAVKDLPMGGSYSIHFDVNAVSLLSNVTAGKLTITFKDSSTIVLDITPEDVDDPTKIDVGIVITGAADSQAAIASSYLLNLVGNILISDTDVLTANATVNEANGVTQLAKETAIAWTTQVASIVEGLYAKVIGELGASDESSIDLNEVVWPILQATFGGDGTHDFKADAGDWQELFRWLIVDKLMRGNADDPATHYYVFFVDSKGAVVDFTIGTQIVNGVAKVAKNGELKIEKSSDIHSKVPAATVTGYKATGWGGLEDWKDKDTVTHQGIKKVEGNMIIEATYYYYGFANYTDSDTEWYGINVLALLSTIANMSSSDFSVSANVTTLKVADVMAFVNKFYGKYEAKDGAITSFTPASELEDAYPAFLNLDEKTQAFVSYLLGTSAAGDSVEELLNGTFEIKLDNSESAKGIVKITYTAKDGKKATLTLTVKLG